MTAATVARRPAVGPRLLLPPLVEARTVPDPREVVLLHPTTRSVLLAPVEEDWPVPAAQPASRTALPDPGRLAGAVVLAAVEVLRGTRPLAQLARWLTPEMFEQLATRPDVGGPRPAGPARGATAGPGRPTPERRRPATVRSVRVCRVSARVAEVCVVLHDGERVRAAAARLVAHRQHWRVAVLQIG